MSKPDGGPAFPVVVPTDNLAWKNGMSLRDYFAARAMQAYAYRGDRNPADTARLSYGYADAMLAERAQ